jgi:hypothetical protein
VPDGTSRVSLHIAVGARRYRAEISGKGLRKTCATIREAGAAAVAVVLSGKLEGAVIQDAGIVAQMRVQKAAAA